MYQNPIEVSLSSLAVICGCHPGKDKYKYKYICPGYSANLQPFVSQTSPWLGEAAVFLLQRSPGDFFFSSVFTIFPWCHCRRQGTSAMVEMSHDFFFPSPDLPHTFHTPLPDMFMKKGMKFQAFVTLLPTDWFENWPWQLCRNILHLGKWGGRCNVSLKASCPGRPGSSTSPNSPRNLIDESPTFLSCLPFSFSLLAQPGNAGRRAVRSGLCKGICQSRDTQPMACSWTEWGVSIKHPSKCLASAACPQVRHSFVFKATVISTKQTRKELGNTLCAQKRGRERRGNEHFCACRYRA